MMPAMKRKKLTASQLQNLPISISEARKLLGSIAMNMSDDGVAYEILYLNEIAILLTNNMTLQKNAYN